MLSGAFQHAICYIIIILVVISKNSCEKQPWGSPCKYDGYCRDGSIGDGFWPVTGADVYSHCKDSRCRCNRGMQSLEFRDNNYVCIGTMWGGPIPTCYPDKPHTCINGVCIENNYRHNHRCQCNDGFVYVGGGKCKETVTLDYAADCTTPKSDSVPVCNYDMLMRCHSTGKCGCYKYYFYDVESKTCISKDAYVEKYPEETIVGLDEFCGETSDGLPKICEETANLKCVSEKCKCLIEYFYDVENKTCISKRAYVEKYPEETKAGLDDFCGISSDDVPKVCDENMTCVSKKCKCTSAFYPSYAVRSGENNTCESKASYVQKHNLSSYKVMPGVYCSSGNECITGLRCAKNNECACPYPCNYDNTTIACDCGAVSAMEGASQAVLVGVIGGIAIITFWGYMIKKTINEKSINAKNYNEPASTDCSASVPLRNEPASTDCSASVPLREPYRIKTTTYSTPASVSKPSYPIPPVPTREPSPDPPYPISASSDPNAPDAPTADASQLPPPYLSNSDPIPTSPAPNSSDPASYSTSPAPCTSNPTPYSTSPAPCSSNPTLYSTSPAPYNSDPTPYSTNPAPYTCDPNPYSTNPALYTTDPKSYYTSPTTVPGDSNGAEENAVPGYPIAPNAGQTTGDYTDPNPYPLNPYQPSAPPAVDIYKPIIF